MPQDESKERPPLVVGVREAARLLGTTPASLYHMCAVTRQDRVPCVRWSRRALKFRVADLEKWIEEHSYPARPVGGRPR